MAQKGQVRTLAEYQKACIGPYVNGHMDLKGRFYVPFNPAEISIEEAVGISDVFQMNGRTRQNQMKRGYHAGFQYPVEKSSLWREKSLTTLSVSLFFNTLNDLYQKSYEDVREEIRKLYPYTNTTEKTGASTKAEKARQIYFFWGSIAIAGILKHMSVKYTMFAPDGKPVRAQADISIEGFYVGEKTAAEGGTAGNGAKAKGAGGSTGFAPDMEPCDWRKYYHGGPNPRL